LLPFPPRLALLAAQFLSLFVNDVILTPEEVDGLTANLLVSKEPPRCKTSLRDWLAEHRATIGVKYASELARHF
jgi:NADH dehydrogenase